MKLGKIAASIAILFCLGGASAWGDESSQDIKMAAEAARPLSYAELHALYDNKSWIWKDGAGFFGVSKRAFTSWTGAGKDRSYGEGRWFLPGDGKLCFRATWFAKDGNAAATTCFEHRTDGRNIYQRRLPDGEWYVFRHQPPRADDEARKLKPGDYVKKRYLTNKNYLETR